jgi:PAS domain S-box-containing protein
MSWSQTRQTEDLYDQMTVLIGSAIRLLGGEGGIFVVSNEAFDPQSSSEYTLYHLSPSLLPNLLPHLRQGIQPNSEHVLVTSALSSTIIASLALSNGYNGAFQHTSFERCSLCISDPAGVLGILHCLRPQCASSCFEQGANAGDALPLFVAQLAAGLRSTLKVQSLVKEQERLAAIFQHSTDGILTVDNALRIIDFNPAMEQLTGWHESEVLGRRYYDVLCPQDRYGKPLEPQDSLVLQAFAGQTVVNREMCIAARDGQLFEVSATASCVHSSRGEPMNGILTVRDITREREQEEQRSTFISVISHELQTPIAIIKGYASTLARTNAVLEPEALRLRLMAIEEEADRLNKLVGNLLYASRIQAGGLQMDIAPLDLPPLIESVVRRLHAKSPEVSVTLDLPPNLPTVMADRDRIEEVLQNLLDNAVKYSPRQRSFTVACRATGDEVIVSVSDVGMGISLREQEHIFDRFHRVGNRITQTTPGVGLGLYICRAIVEAHGGHIWVESILRKGSTFSFSLPRVEKAQLPMVVFT